MSSEIIEITSPNVRRETLDGEIIGYGERGEVPEGVADTLVARDEATRIDGPTELSPSDEADEGASE